MDPNSPAAVTPDASQLNAAAPAANVGTPAPQAPVTPQAADALSLTELNSLLGRKFDSKESALKSIKDTYSFATTRVTDISKEAAAAVSGELKKLGDTVEAQNKEMFYLQHPEHAPHRKLIDSLGKNPAEVVLTDVYKDTSTKLAAHDQTVKLKTVLESNPRLAAASDTLTKAADLKKAQNGFVTKSVEALVVQGVNEAFGLK